MSQFLPVLPGSGSLLGIAESPQSTLAGGVKGVSSEGGFSTVMSRAAVQQKAEESQGNKASGDVLPSGGVELPLAVDKGDAPGGWGEDFVVGVASVAEELMPPSQTVEQIERFITAELNVEQNRSEFSRLDSGRSSTAFDVASQANTTVNTAANPANSVALPAKASVESNVPVSKSSATGEYRAAVLSGLDGGHAATPGIQGELQSDSVLLERSTEQSRQFNASVAAQQLDSADDVKQLQDASAIRLEMAVSDVDQGSDALVRLPGLAAADSNAQQGEGGQNSVSLGSVKFVPPSGSEKAEAVSVRSVLSDSVEQEAALVSSKGEGAAAVVPLAVASDVTATAAGERLTLAAGQSVGRYGVNGQAPFETAPLSSTVAAANAREGQGNSSLADGLARLQATNVSQAEQNQLQSRVSLSAADKSLQDKVGLEHKSESSIENLATSIATAAKAVKPQSDMLQLPMPNGLRPGMPAWNQAVNERIVFVQSQNGQMAEIQLDPPELGSLQVKLQVKNDQVSIIFNTPHGAVRDALEQGLPRLREMFAEQGLNLTDSSVEDQNTGHNQEGSGERQNTPSGYSGFEEDADSPIAVTSQGASLSLVDYYA